MYVLAIMVKDVLLLSVAGAEHHDQGNLQAKVFNWICGFRGLVPWWQSESVAAEQLRAHISSVRGDRERDAGKGPLQVQEVPSPAPKVFPPVNYCL